MRRALYILFFVVLFLVWLWWVSPRALLSAAADLNLTVLCLALSFHFPIAWLQGIRLFHVLALEKPGKIPCVMLYFVCFPLSFFLSAAALPVQALLFRNLLGVGVARFVLSLTFVHLFDMLLASATLLFFPLPMAALASGTRAFAGALVKAAAALVATVLIMSLFFPPMTKVIQRKLTTRRWLAARGVTGLLDELIRVSLSFASRRLQLKVLLISFLTYTLEIALTYISFHFAVGIPFPLLNAAQGIAVGRFLAFFPNPPLDIGQHEVSVTFVYTGLFGLPVDKIGAVAFVSHLITIPLFLLIGFIGAASLRLSLRDLISLRRSGRLSGPKEEGLLGEELTR